MKMSDYQRRLRALQARAEPGGRLPRQEREAYVFEAFDDEEDRWAYAIAKFTDREAALNFAHMSARLWNRRMYVVSVSSWTGVRWIVYPANLCGAWESTPRRRCIKPADHTGPCQPETIVWSIRA